MNELKVADHYKPLWRFVNLNEFAPPVEPARETVRKGLHSLKVWLGNNSVVPTRGIDQADLRSVPPLLLDLASPPPEWWAITEALHEELFKWASSDKTDQLLKVIITPPGDKMKTVLSQLGEYMNWNVISPPSPEAILSGGDELLMQLQLRDQAPLIFPNWEKFYLRHQDGLTLMRGLLEWLECSQQKAIIGCNSISWAFLCKALQMDSRVQSPLTLSSLSGSALQHWFQSKSQKVYSLPIVFRLADDGTLAVPADSSDLDSGWSKAGYYDDQAPTSYFMRQLAAYSLGLPEVAWLVWRQALQISSDDIIKAEIQAEAQADERYTMWVHPFSLLDLPTIPAQMGTEALIILYALLLHDGLSVEALTRILPFSAAQLRQTLFRLQDEYLLTTVDFETWRVDLMAYPLVRQTLATEGYLVSSL